ncbi:alpha/beta hydrolase [Skermania sp. ID1734]|uniref:alpha/beta hydrolase n=1 Tax=Skermania sp. ID1734 TaxID=2597516 RepID=UPI00117BE36D|nr:alpha/beta hydrolase [Skermania sp. ID1734]TSD93547.1 alpha/beta hydrolase [Skermania sp. ID1734]
MELRQIGARTVRIDGPESRHSVLLLPAAAEPGTVYDDVCTRLHNSGLRTIVAETLDGLDEAGIAAILDELKIGWVNLVGSREGAGLAWLFAARTFGRVASLVVADCCHPAVPDLNGEVLAADCPPVELPTTLIIGSSLLRPQADVSGRKVYADFRIVQLDGVDNVPLKAAAEMATEIVLRTSSW